MHERMNETSKKPRQCMQQVLMGPRRAREERYVGLCARVKKRSIPTMLCALVLR